MPNSVPEKPWVHISVDFITKLLLVQGYNSILVVVDRLTKMVHFILTTEKISAEGLARLFRDNVWKLHGLPESIISDRGPQFMVGIVTNFIWTITLGILGLFQQSKWPLKAFKKTFQMVPKMSQGDQYPPSYQQISWQSPSHQILNH